MTSPLRVGIVGAGLMGGGIARVLDALPGATVAAVASRTRADAETLAADLGAAAFDDHRRLIAAGGLDAVVVATPDDAHTDIVVDAASAGLHVLVEKPLATSVADADACVAAVRGEGVVGMCLYNHRWIPAYAQAKDLVGGLGAPAVGYARKNDTLHVPTRMLGWAHRTTSAWFLSSHDIDLLTWLCDDHVEQVHATARYGKLRGLGVDTPDAVVIHARFRGGAVATFESAWIHPDTFPTMVDSYVSLVCDDGVIQLDRQRENIAVATAEGYTYPRNTLQRVVHGVPGGAYRDAIAHFVDCAATGREPLVTVESSRHVTAVLAAAHASLDSGRPEVVR